MSSKDFPFIPYIQDSISDEEMIERSKSFYEKIDKRR